MKTKFRESREFSVVRTQCNIMERAARLWSDGYIWEIDANDPYLFTIENTEGHRYTVDLRHKTCNCPAHDKYGDCKHYIAVVNDPDCKREFRYIQAVTGVTK